MVANVERIHSESAGKPTTGIEPATCRLRSDCSSGLSYVGTDDRVRTGDLFLTKEVRFHLHHISVSSSGGTRTPNLTINSRPLYL